MDEVTRIVNDIKAGNIQPIYFLMGEEPYFIDKISEYIENHVLPEEQKGFDQMVMYGEDTNVLTLVGAAKKFPMLGDKQVIIVREAQSMKGSLNDLLSYVENPQPSTVLVICYKYKKLDGKLKIAKALKKGNYIFESKKLYENQVGAWMTRVLKSKKLTIEPKAQAMLIEFLGTDLNRISSEIDKLSIILKPGEAVTSQVIEENIGFSKDYNNFELINAINQMQVEKAYRIVNHFSKDPSSNPVFVVISSLFYHFKKVMIYHSLKDKSQAATVLKMSPYFVKDIQLAAKNFPPKKVSKIIADLHILDCQTKGYDVGTVSHNDFLKEMLFRVFA